MRTLWRTFVETTKLVTTHRKLWVPFLVMAIAELGVLAVGWLAPHPPFSRLLAPPVRYFFGERVLHYPWHLWFLFHVMKHTYFAAATLIGAFMSGLACEMIRQIHQGQPVSLHVAWTSKRVRYSTMVCLWLISWAVGRGFVELLVQLAPHGKGTAWAAVGVVWFLQGLLAYAIPAAVFEGSRWVKALAQGIREFLHHPVSTLIIVAGPSLAVLFFALVVSDNQVSLWMDQIAPEIALAFVALRLIVWTVADAVLTVSVAHLWWLHRASAPAIATIGGTAAAGPPANSTRRKPLRGVSVVA